MGMKTLEKIRKMSEASDFSTLSDEWILKALQKDSLLALAIEEAYEHICELKDTYPQFLTMPEKEQISQLQEGYINFYDDLTINPYVPLAARGPWIITSKGGVIHDSGGYGMLGFGHAPDNLLASLKKPSVMANVMTASFSQKRFTEQIRREIGHTHADKSEMHHHIVCLNSGSEAMTMGARFSDLYAKLQLDKKPGKKLKFISMKGSFHGRTDKPSQISDSCLPKYRKHLASFVERDNLMIVPMNDKKALSEAFEKAEEENVHIEAVFAEPVMGEGNPGVPMDPDFYDHARKLTLDYGSLLVIDSVQAGLRAHGVLSIVDYPGFQNSKAPDLEAFSKAVNAGQYPLSVLAVHPRLAPVYQKGMYGNTMTTNPRALEIASAVLDGLDEKVRHNISQQGKTFVEKFQDMQKKYPRYILSVQGTGLLFATELDPKLIEVVGVKGIEKKLRQMGVGVIHGGKNALRFTPHFKIDDFEVDMICKIVDEAIKSYMS